MANSLYKDPIVFPYSPCPNCAHLLDIEIERCPHCQELIDEDQRLFGAILHVNVTQACSLANSIATGDPAIVIFLAIAVMAYVLDFAWMLVFNLPVVIMAMGVIVRWFWRYAWLPVDDEELFTAKREMRRSLLLWCAFAFFETVVVYLSWP